MSNLNILIIRFRLKDRTDAPWYFLVDPDDRPIMFTTQEFAWDRANQLNLQDPDNEYVPNVLTSSMSVAEFDTNKAQVSQYEAVVTDLRDTNVTLTRAIEAAKQAHQSDLDTISAFCNEEADSRDYCDTYDELMRDLDRKLVGNLTFRSREYIVTTRYTFDITHRVTATSSNDAEADELGQPELIDKLARAVRRGEYESESPDANLADD